MLIIFSKANLAFKISLNFYFCWIPNGIFLYSLWAINFLATTLAIITKKNEFPIIIFEAFSYTSTLNPTLISTLVLSLLWLLSLYMVINLAIELLINYFKPSFICKLILYWKIFDFFFQTLHNLRKSLKVWLNWRIKFKSWFFVCIKLSFKIWWNDIKT